MSDFKICANEDGTGVVTLKSPNTDTDRTIFLPDADTTLGVTAAQSAVLDHLSYDATNLKIVADRAIETTLNSLFLGEQHKMSSGSENIFFTNLSSDINFFPMWGGLKDQSIVANQGASGFIPPSGRVYSDMFSLPLGGQPDPITSTGYSGDNYFGINITGLGITTVAAEEVPASIRLEYRIVISGKQVYMQPLPRNAARSSAAAHIYAGDTIEWFFDHPVDVRAGTTLNASIHKVRISDDVDLGIFQVRQGDTVDPNTGLFRYQATVHNRLFEDKDIELISPYLKYQAMDFSVDATGVSIVLKDLSLSAGAQVLVPHPINTLEAVASGTKIQIKVKDGSKVICEALPVNAVSVNGVFVNAILNSAVAELNNLFTNAVSFANQGNPVLNVLLSSNYLTIILEDLTSFSVDITALGVDTNRHVTSGAVVGTDLILTMNDGINPVTVDVSNMISGSGLNASNDAWYISYGTNADQAVGTGTNDSTINQQLPFYFGQPVTKGSEFKWNFQSNGGANLILGIWDGAEVAIAYNGGSITASNWGTMFLYASGFTAGSNTTMTTTNSGAKYVVPTGDACGVRFDNAGHLVLVHYTGGNEVEIARTTIALAVTSFKMQMHTWANGVLPNGIINNVDYIWDIVHDFAGTEGGILNGILDHTVLKSALSISPNEKLMFMLDEVGQGDFFGTNYTAAATGVSTAEEQLNNEFVYENNEALSFVFGGTGDWNVNTNATYHFDNGAGVIGYRKGGANTIQGMFSLRYLSDNSIELWSEDQDELVATAKSNGNGSPIHLFFGVRGNRAYYSIPVISKQALTQGSQPLVHYVPTVANQTVSVAEGGVLNFSIVSSSNIVNQFVEVDAPSWMFMNQATGVLSGTAPAYAGTAADTIVVNCKAGNAIGGTVSFTVTVTVTQVVYTNSNSLAFNGSSTFLQGNPVNMNALERATNGDGNAWTISMWVKPTSSTGNQTLMVYGAGNDYNGGAITLKQSGGTSIVLNYGTVYNSIILVCGNALTASTWQHVMVTFDGGTTGSVASSASDYYSRFSVYVDGVLQSPIGVATGGGYDGALSGANPSDNIYRIGRASNVHNNYTDATINQVGIWSSDQSANVATIYNSGATQDLSQLAAAPAHYYEIDTSITSITDLSGSADLVGYNFTGSNLVSDTP